MKIFSIKNEKYGYFNYPIYRESEAEALSYVQSIFTSDFPADRALSNLKDEFALYYLGDIDFTSGKIHSGDDPIKICSFLEIFDTIKKKGN